MSKLCHAIAVLAVALAGCQKEQPTSTQKVAIANKDAERLKSLTPPLRNVALRNTIRDSGSHCDRVDASAYQQEHKQLSMWTAHCTDSGDFAIFVGANGEGQVRPCSDAKALGIPQCRRTSGT
jgi:hypothetical protein